jgi:DUF1365 family protein
MVTPGQRTAVPTADLAAPPAHSAAPAADCAAAALYECRITHVRTSPLRNAFTYGSYLWFVDLDHLPEPACLLRPLTGFRSRDHLGDPGATIRQNVDDFLARRGIDLHGGQIMMLTQARVLGYVFNPLTVYWCHDAGGALACVVAEVHNTYHQRHCYLLHTDERGRAQTAKEFYVSPYYPVEGSYRMTLPEPGERLSLTIVLDRPDGHPFVASIRGARRPATGAALLRAAMRHPWSTAAVSARIYAQGIKLYVRGLRPAPRPWHPSQEGVE